MCPRMDEGLPIAYEVLGDGVPVYSSDAELLGTVEHVVAAAAQDIFHGIVMSTEVGRRFVAADQIASLHERGVDLRIAAAAARTLPEPHGAAPAWRVQEPGVRPSRWRHVLDKLEGVAPTRRYWTKEE
jgi:hypothetical protein